MKLITSAVYLAMIAINIPFWPSPFNALVVGVNIGLIWVNFVNWIFEDVLA